MKKGIKIILSIVGVCLGIIVVGFILIMKDIPTISKMPIQDVKIEVLDDGIYTGKYEYSRWLSEVKVVVKGKEIKSISLLSPPLTPDISNELFSHIISEQKINVDVLSGATATSKAYLKSVENALINKE